MKKILERDSNTIPIATFWENYQLGKYDFDPAYQRLSVWSEEKQSFLIDSILKNFPIPPIFLNQKIDNKTGKTNFEIIDGKQRLTAIIAFIEGQISVSSELDGGILDDENLAGSYFQDLDTHELSDYKAHFWRYQLPVEYVDATHTEIIDNVFDRLNRNGEPLNGQELRNSQYNKTELLRSINDLSDTSFWKTHLSHLDRSRMEDIEFLSELIFTQYTETAMESSQDKIDELYEKYSNENIDWNVQKQKFAKLTNFMESLDVDYTTHKIRGVSHLYGLWCLTIHCVNSDIEANTIKDNLDTFYTQLRQKSSNANIQAYIKTMSYSTKGKSQRKRRVEALKVFLDI